MGGWFTTKKLSGGGSLIDIGVHVLDLALWFMDYPDPIDVRSSWGSRFGSRGRGGAVNSWRANYHDGVFDVDDYAMGFLNFGAGRSMMLQVSWASHIEKDDSGVELWGTEGGAKLSPLQVFTTDGDGHLNTTPAFPNVYPFDVSTAHFVNVIKGREPLACPPEEALQTIQVIERIYGAPDSHA
jgi:predicted dehydrogenase